MLIGIDASRAFIKERTGTENYSSHLIQKLIEIDKKNRYWLYVREMPRTIGSLIQKKIIGGAVAFKVVSWRRFWTQLGLARECLLRPPDILFIPAHTMPVIRRPSLKTVVTIHGLEYEYLPEYYKFPQKLYLNKSTEYAVRHADRLISVSQWTKSQLVERLGADPKKISVIYEGVSQTPRIVARQRSRFLRGEIVDKPYILFVGTVQPRKNLVRLIKAFSILQARSNQARKQALDLIIAGKLGWMYKEILEAPRKFGVEKRVKFLGYVADNKLASLYQNALFFILPSLCEGFGLPILEAMSWGCPVISSHAGALPEVVAEAGLLVNPLQTKEIVDAMELMVKSQELRQGLREKGFKRVRQFSWEKAAQETLEVFEKIY